MSTSLTFDIIARDRASDKFDKVGKSASGSADKLKKFAKIGGAAVAAAGLVVGKFALDSIQSASHVEQSFGALDSVYGRNAKQVKKWAEGAADSVGLAKGEYADLSALVGSQLQGMGTSSDKAAKKSNDLIKMGADLAATFGGSVKDAVEAVSSTLKGETDPIERYGVSIKASDVSARKAAMGLDGLTGAADKQATATATLALLTEQTGKAQGAFGRESDTLAGKQERLGAKFENLKATIGAKLLPVVTQFFGFLLDKGVPAVQKLGDWFMQKLMPPIRDFAEKAAPKARDIMDALAGAFQDAKPFLKLVGEILTNVVVPAMKKLLEFAGPVLVTQIRGVGKALGFIGEKGEWMWEKVLRPVISKILEGFQKVATWAANVLDAVSKAPKMGWAADAADKLRGMADQAKAADRNIRGLPTYTQVSISINFLYPKGKPTKNIEDTDDWLNNLGSGRMVAGGKSSKSASQKFMEAIADGIEAGGKKLDKVLIASRDRIKGKLGQIRDDMKSMSSSIASALTPDAFSFSDIAAVIDETTGAVTTQAQTALQQMMGQLTGTNGALSSLTSVFATLKGSVSKGFLSSIMQSGNTSLMQQLAADPAAAAQASSLFESNAAMATGLGDQTAQAVLGDRIDAAFTREIDRLLAELKEAPEKYATKLERKLEKIKVEFTGPNSGRIAYTRTGGWGS